MKRFTERRWAHRIAGWAQCPLPDPLELPDSGAVLVVAPHPDDETLGAGGTLALLAARGCDVHVVVVTDGRTEDPLGVAGGDVVEARREETRRALAVLGVDAVRFWDEPDGRFRNSTAFTQRFAALLEETSPRLVFLPSPLDYHRDHVAIALACLGPCRREAAGALVLLYEIWCPLPATRIVDITPVAEQKREAIRCYGMPLAYRNYLDGSMGLAAYRGTHIGGADEQRYAEAFLALDGSDLTGSMPSRLLEMRRFLEEVLNG